MNDMNEQKKNRSIKHILAQGLAKPQTTRARIAEMFRTIGVRYIFWDTGYSLFFAAVTLATVLALFAAVPDSYRYSASVAVAPLTFLFVTAFAETSERVCGLYELKQTCRYTIRQITALRVLCYSVAGAVFTAVIAVMKTGGFYEFFAMFLLCLSALFTCSALSLFIMRFTRKIWENAAFSAVWVFASIALPFSRNEKWELLLSRVPIAVSAVIALIGIALFAFQMSKMLLEVKNHAYT